MALSPPQDRRIDPRKPGAARGVVTAHALEVGCVIADVSVSGLRVRLDRQMALPSRVVVVDIAAGVAHEVELVWQKAQEAGLKRAAQTSLRGLSPSRLVSAREAWIRAGGR